MSGSRFGCPEADWNGKIEMLGNGGYSSAMAFPAMAEQLKHGYAAPRPIPGTRATIPISRPAIPKRSSTGRAARSTCRSTQRRRSLRTSTAVGAPRVFLGLLHRRPAGADRGAALPERLRRHHRRRPRQQSHAPQRRLPLAVRQEPPRRRPERHRAAGEARRSSPSRRQGMPGQGRRRLRATTSSPIPKPAASTCASFCARAADAPIA